MFKMVFLVHKRPDMDSAAFYRYWKETHGPIVAKIPGVRRYVQNHSTAHTNENLPTYDGLAELWFDNAEAFERGLASPEGQAALADARNFLAIDRLQSFSVQEIPII